MELHPLQDREPPRQRLVWYEGVFRRIDGEQEEATYVHVSR